MSVNITSQEKDKVLLLGQKLAFFVAALPINDEEKLVLVSAIQQLSLPEMEKLAELADRIYAESKTAKIDEKFKTDLMKIKKEYDERNEKLDKEFLEKLAELQNKLDK